MVVGREARQRGVQARPEAGGRQEQRAALSGTCLRGLPVAAAVPLTVDTWQWVLQAPGNHAGERQEETPPQQSRHAACAACSKARRLR